MYPHFINFLNPVSNTHFIVALRPLDGQKLINKYYPQLHFVHFSIPDNNNFATVINFIIRKSGINTLKEGLDALSPIFQDIYKGKLHDQEKVNNYILDAILGLTNKISADLPDWHYVQRTCAINVYKRILSAISKKDPRFTWREIPNNNFGDSFIICYDKGNIRLTDNDYVIINRFIKANGEGRLIEIMSVKQEGTNYRKSLEKLIFDKDVRGNSDGIFYSFSLKNYMWMKYHAVKYSEL